MTKPGLDAWTPSERTHAPMLRTPCRSALAIFLTCILSAVAACSGEEAPSVPRYTYELRGQIVALDPDRGTLTVEHEELEGYMSAMTMPFNVRDQWVFQAAEPGARIGATLVIEGDSSWIEQVVINKASAAGQAMQAVIPMAQQGDPVPEIELVDQDGETISITGYRGEYLLFTFIYTRCPLPDFCPRVSLNFERVFQAVSADPQRYGAARLLSISVDPAYDTPELLHAYGVKYLEELAPQGFDRWAFATADAEQLRTIAGFVGLRFMPESGEIIHSLRTVVVDPEGTVAKVYIGNTWRPEAVLADLEAMVSAAAAAR